MERQSETMVEDLPPCWQAVMAGEFVQPYFQQLEAFVEQERQAHQVFPPAADVFNAFRAAPFASVRVLLLGQDPYHGEGQAHGLCFSVRPGIKPPPSLVNIFKELHADLGVPIPKHGYLQSWAEQGILMLNTVLTVRAHEANSHKNQGWELFTDSVIRALSGRADPLVFVLWGGQAQKKQNLIDESRHIILKAAHPSPLSVRMFKGTRPFSAINTALATLGKPGIDWRLPEIISPADDANGDEKDPASRHNFPR